MNDDDFQKLLDNLENRPVHDVLTKEVLSTAADFELVEIVTDILIKKLPSDYEQIYKCVMSWTVPQQTIAVIWWLIAEVQNGGFNQFFYNRSEYAPLIPDALEKIGALKYADLAKRAYDVYKKELKNISKHQDGTLKGYSESCENNPLDEFDDEFYDLEESEDLEKLQAEYIRENRFDFING